MKTITALRAPPSLSCLTCILHSPNCVDLKGEEPEILQGKSLAGYLNGKEPENTDAYAYTVSYQGRDATLRTLRWRYTRWGEKIEQGNEELYDHKNDPEEFVNLADNSDFKVCWKK
jgi:iduronate 2-sulfatase